MGIADLGGEVLEEAPLGPPAGALDDGRQEDLVPGQKARGVACCYDLDMYAADRACVLGG